jgi:hypothetical protein
VNSRVDWSAIRSRYVTSGLTLRQVAEEFVLMGRNYEYKNKRSDKKVELGATMSLWTSSLLLKSTISTAFCVLLYRVTSPTNETSAGYLEGDGALWFMQ